MSWDIYGNALRRGYCEVHPHVNQEYPCSLCHEEMRRDQDENRRRNVEMQSHHETEMIQQKIDELTQERQDLVTRLYNLVNDGDEARRVMRENRPNRNHFTRIEDFKEACGDHDTALSALELRISEARETLKKVIQ